MESGAQPGMIEVYGATVPYACRSNFIGGNRDQKIWLSQATWSNICREKNSQIIRLLSPALLYIDTHPCSRNTCLYMSLTPSSVHTVISSPPNRRHTSPNPANLQLANDNDSCDLSHHSVVFVVELVVLPHFLTAVRQTFPQHA